MTTEPSPATTPVAEADEAVIEISLRPRRWPTSSVTSISKARSA